MNIKNKLKIVNLSDIKPYENNAKKHSLEQIELIKKSLTDNNYYSPIGVDANNTIVFGHGRYLALKELDNKQKIEVVDLSYLSPVQIKKLRILDNKIVSNDYDKDILQSEIESLYKNLNIETEKVINELSVREDEIALDLSIEEFQDTKKRTALSSCPKCGFQW